MISKEAVFSKGQKLVCKGQVLNIFRRYCLVLLKCNVIYEEIIITTIFWHLPDARHCIRPFISLSCLILLTTLHDSHYYLHFINEESKVQMLINLLKIISLASGRANICFQIYMTQGQAPFLFKNFWTL